MTMSEAITNGVFSQARNRGRDAIREFDVLLDIGIGIDIDTNIDLSFDPMNNLDIKAGFNLDDTGYGIVAAALIGARLGSSGGPAGIIAGFVAGAFAGAIGNVIANEITKPGIVTIDVNPNTGLLEITIREDYTPPTYTDDPPPETTPTPDYPNDPPPGTPANPDTTGTTKTSTKDPRTTTTDDGGDGNPGTPPTTPGRDPNSKQSACSSTPVILDLDGDGVELIDISNSQVLFDWMGNGFAMLTGWAAADDGFLAYDKNSDGVIRDADELSFTSYYDGADTDLEGLKGFDSNADGVLSALDDEWSKFGVWQDANSDGIQDEGEFTTLAERGISEISLTSDNRREEIGHNVIHGKTSYTTEDQELHELADTGLLFVPLGVKQVSAEQNVYDLIVAGYIVRLVGTSDEAFSQHIDMETDNLRAVFSGNGADVISAALSNNNVVVYGGAGDDTISGGAGNDFLVGGSGADIINGGAGDDIILFDAQDLESGGINGGAGYDLAIYADDSVAVDIDLADLQIEAAAGGAGNDILVGTADDNLLLGAAGDDSLSGGDGNDLLIGGEGDDTLNGGAGNDILFLDDEDSSWYGGAGVDTAFYEGEDDLILEISSRSVEIFFSGDGDDVLYTTPELVAFIHGGDGDDQIHGGRGDDWLAGGRGNDALYGSYSDDTYFFQRGDGSDTIHDFYQKTYTHTQTYLYSNGEVKDVVYTTRTREYNAGDDKLVLGDEINLEDLFITRSGNNLNIDFVYSSSNDLENREEEDRITLNRWDSANQQIENLELADGLVIDWSTISNWLMGTEDQDKLIGNEQRNWLNGGEGNDKLVGAAGDDVLVGGDGDDLLVGGRGADVLYGGAGSDTVSYERSFVRVNINLQNKVARCGEAKGDTLHSIENIIGSRGGDTIIGDANSNLLSGRAGSDRLYGRAGNDNKEAMEKTFFTDSDELVARVQTISMRVTTYL